MRRHGELELLVVLPDGSKTLMPAGWTDASAAREVEPGPGTLGALGDLLHAVAVVAALLPSAGPGRVEADGESSQEAPNARTAAPPDAGDRSARVGAARGGGAGAGGARGVGRGGSRGGGRRVGAADREGGRPGAAQRAGGRR